MSTRAIEVENLGKLYQLGDDASKHNMADMFMPWRRLPNPNDFWALKDINFNIEAGESVGIIGRNGAGKSTLLKILSRITAPTRGRVKVQGRVGTLLEVGTGFHPELSGRDNIFLNGTILGLSYAEVKKRFDEIVDFAGVEKFIDTPVKRYSSGMQVRLAFAVALYLEPEILIIDEVLAVGDLAFQRKSLNRLGEVTGRDGRTVLFVSHSLEAIKKSCQRVLVLEGGELKFDGLPDEGIEFYRDSVPFVSEGIKDSNLKNRRHRTTGDVRFTKIEAFDQDRATWRFKTGQTARFEISYEVAAPVNDLSLLFRVLAPVSELGGNQPTIVANISIPVADSPLPAGARGVVEVVLPDIKLRPGDFPLYIVAASKDDRFNYDVLDDNVNLPTLSIKSDDPARANRLGLVSLDYRFAIKRDRSGEIKRQA